MINPKWKITLLIVIPLIIIGVFSPIGFHLAEAGVVFDAVSEAFLSVIKQLIIAVLHLWGMFLGLAGLILNQTLNYAVVGMAKNISDITGIQIAWGAIRDAINICFLFFLLYIAIGTILGEESVNFKKMLPKIVIAALFINFSLFFTKAIVDGSNIITIGFYNQIVGVGSVAADGTTSVAGGIANRFMSTLNLGGIFDPKALVSGGSAPTLGKLLIIGIGGSAVLITLTFSFMAIAVMFLVRFLVLIMLMILSPIAFGVSVFPRLKGYSDDWWNTLWGQCLFAPVYMALTWIILKIMSSPGFLSMRDGSNSIASTLTGDIKSTGSVGVLINFIIIIGFIFASIIIAKKMATEGSSMIGKAIGAGQGMLVGGAMGLGAYAGRQTIGRASNMMAQSNWLKEAASKQGFGGVAARLGLQTTQGVAKNSFDVRSAPGVGDMFAKDFGGGKAGGKGGYVKEREDSIKADTEMAKNLGYDKEKVEPMEKKAKELEDKIKKEKDEITNIRKEIVEKRKQAKESKIPEFGKQREEEANELETKLNTKISEQNSQQTELKTLQDQTEKEKERRQRDYAEYVKKGGITGLAYQKVTSPKEELWEPAKKSAVSVAKATKNTIVHPVSTTQSAIKSTANTGISIAKAIRTDYEERSKAILKGLKQETPGEQIEKAIKKRVEEETKKNAEETATPEPEASKPGK